MTRRRPPSHNCAFTLPKDEEGKPTGEVLCDWCGATALAVEDITHAQTCPLFRSAWDGLDFWESEDVRDLAREHAVRPEPDVE